MKLSTEYLQTLQDRIDMIGSNLANASTTGFKEQLLSIEECYDVQDRSNTMAQYGGMLVTQNPVIHINQYDGNRIDFTQGSLVSTGNPLDLAICGDGFFQVKTADGKLGYTRSGAFSVDAAGNLVNNQGMLLEPKVAVPENVTDISVDSDGTIYGVQTAAEEKGQTVLAGKEENQGNTVILGKISVFCFTNPDGLEQAGNNVFYATEASGKVIAGIPGEDGYGVIKSAMLEKSNTNLLTAMTDLIRIQRAYQIDVRIRQDLDEMTAQTIAMRR
jgi:flagellar basal-body rod protein FlgG